MTIEFSNLQQYIQWFAKELYDDRIVEHLESCSMYTLKNAVSTFKEMGILKLDSEIQETGKSVESVARTAIEETELIALEKKLSQFMKRSYVTQLNNPVDIAKRTVFADYPFMAKLWEKGENVFASKKYLIENNWNLDILECLKFWNFVEMKNKRK